MPPASVLEPGRYVCVSTPGFVAWVIRRACRSRVNHAFLVTGPGEIIEATPRGVRRGALSEYKGMYAVANILEPMTNSECQAVVAKMETLLGDGYNFPVLVAIGLEDIGWHWKLLLRIAGADHLLDCSQAVCVAGGGAVPPMPWQCGRSDPSQVTPADLARRDCVEQVTL